jgi:hypothetical protein
MAKEMQSHTHTSDDAVSPPTVKPTLRRAFDCCRKRKVKCDGHEPCTPCKKASIRCAYLQPPKKKGPKGLRSARVLHALRRIDDSASGTPTSPLSPEQNGHFGGWAWSVQAHANASSSMGYQEQHVPPPPGLPHGLPTSMPQQHTFTGPMEQPTAQHTQQMPFQQQYFPQAQSYQSDSGQGWSYQDPMSATSDTVPSIASPASSDRFYRSPRIQNEAFHDYVVLFFTHMFPIMPIIPQNVYLDPELFVNSRHMAPALYCFLCALCATTIIQLDASIPTPPTLRPGKAMDDVFAEECIRERRDYDYMTTSTLSVMTSFFLFCYHGNHERHERAWYYLQESITLAENLNLDDEEAYSKLNSVEAQWRRRLYWLLFITERAYAVQRRKRTRLTPSVDLPTVFASEDGKLLNGFVNLANLFSAVDDSFVSAWRGSRRQSLCNEAWLMKTQRELDATARGMGELSETQHLDISVTREWLHVLAWQMGVSNGLIWGQGEGGMRLDYPIELAKKVVEITASATSEALDSHGIGMVSVLPISSFSFYCSPRTYQPSTTGTKTLRHRWLPCRRPQVHRRRHFAIPLRRQTIPQHPAATSLQHSRQRIALPPPSHGQDGRPRRLRDEPIAATSHRAIGHANPPNPHWPRHTNGRSERLPHGSARPERQSERYGHAEKLESEWWVYVPAA